MGLSRVIREQEYRILRTGGGLAGTENGMDKTSGNRKTNNKGGIEEVQLGRGSKCRHQKFHLTKYLLTQSLIVIPINFMVFQVP